jgi:transcriptional regulator
LYLPKSFQVEDQRVIWEFIQRYPFATLISTLPDGGTFVSHIPVLVDEATGILCGHLAGANPHADLIGDKKESILVFHGPDAYISPAWYGTHEAVPTWAYATVHAFGQLLEVSEARKKEIVDLTTRHFESGRVSPWKERLDERFMARMLAAIVGFEMKPARLEAKFKLGQNRSIEDRKGVLKGLLEEGTASSREMAEFIQRHAHP